MTVKELLKELASTTCRCGKDKKAKETFCKTCYFLLPMAKRRALYKRVGEGYEEAYQDACSYIGLTIPKQ